MALTYEQAIAQGTDPQWAAANLPRTGVVAPPVYQPAPTTQPMNRASTYFNPDTQQFAYTPQGYASGAAYEQAQYGGETRLPWYKPPTPQELYQMQVNRSQPIIDRSGQFTPQQLQPSYAPPLPQQTIAPWQANYQTPVGTTDYGLGATQPWQGATPNTTPTPYVGGVPQYSTPTTWGATGQPYVPPQEAGRESDWLKQNPQYSPNAFTGAVGGFLNAIGKTSTPPAGQPSSLYDQLDTHTKETNKAAYMTQGFSGEGLGLIGSMLNPVTAWNNLLDIINPTRDVAQLKTKSWNKALAYAVKNPTAEITNIWLDQPAHLDQPGMEQSLEGINQTLIEAKLDPIPETQYQTITNGKVGELLANAENAGKPSEETEIKETPQEKYNRERLEQLLWDRQFRLDHPELFPEKPEQTEDEWITAKEQALKWQNDWLAKHPELKEKTIAEQQKEYNDYYWSNQAVEERRKRREEEDIVNNEGWKGFLDTLDGLQLSPMADEYFGSAAMFNKLRTEWLAQGGGQSWESWLKNYDFKDAYAKLAPYQRGERYGTYAPAMRSVSF